jgi:peroxiredoxin
MKRTLFATVAVAFAMAMFVTTARAGEGAKVGEAAPDFSLQDQDGKTVNLADLKGKVVVLEWFNEECPYVVRHHEKDKTMSTVSDKYASKDVVWLAINSTDGKTNETNKAAQGKWNVKYSILNDSEQKVAKAYGAKATPHMFIIDKEGKLAYAGGIDNDPKGEKTGDAKVNFVDKALAELTDGKTVSEPKTQQYGCSVKYKKDS